MEERRRAQRHARQFEVHFGVSGLKGFPTQGLTHDVSSSGIFVLSKASYAPGTRLHLEVMMKPEESLYLEGVVAREVKAPNDPSQSIGFGVRFLQGSELLFAMLGEAQPKADQEDPYTLTFETQEHWRAIWAQDVRSGVCFLWAPEPPTLNELVTLKIELRHQRLRFSFEARVIHTMRGPDGRHGLALMFVDVAAATAQLLPTLSS